MSTTMRLLPDYETFCQLAAIPGRQIPLYRRLLSDAMTPVQAFRRLVRPDDRMAPSFLFESVLDGRHVGRYSFLGHQPIAQFIAYGNEVVYHDHVHPDNNSRWISDDPLADLADRTRSRPLAPMPGLPTFTGGWVGFAAYDTVRYLEPDKLDHMPHDDRHLPDVHMQLYRDVVAFDHVQKTMLLITHVCPEDHTSLEQAYAAGTRHLDDLMGYFKVMPDEVPPPADLLTGHVDLATAPPALPVSNMGEGGYQEAVRRCKEYIMAGDAFQIVPSQRFDLLTRADPFDIYRMLRVVNPSPYMFYLQIDGGMLIGSSPETLCQVTNGRIMTRPLAGTRRRGATDAEDQQLERELQGDPKDRAEHIMLVDLGRNDVGVVAQPGTIDLPQVLAVERYSHVMHLSSTVTGTLRAGMSVWDALRAILPVGTVSGAPKIRAMQIIDELEPTRRGPYGGAVGYVDLAGNMDMAIALRTMVALPDPDHQGQWKVHLQAGAGIVADSDPDLEHQETVNKAAALAKAVALAEQALAH